MKSSPCAKLTTSMMPKINVSPDATSARIIPVTTPLMVWTRIWSSGMSMSDSEVPVDHRIVHAELRGHGVMAHLALFDEIDPPAGLQRQWHVLLDQQHRHAFVAQRADDLGDLRDHARHQPFGRLVEQNDLGLERHRTRDRQHLLLAARQRAAALVAPLAEDREIGVYLVEQLGPLRLVDALAVEPGAQVLEHGEQGKDPAFLGDVADTEPRHLVRCQAADG